jgi:sodium/proline symporter
MIILSFCLFLFAMTGIGIFSAKKSKNTSQDYLLANRSIGPIATSLSAVSTCHSGFMFIGMIGFTYSIGISTLWLIISWMIGDYFAWRVIYKPLRKKTETLNVSTIPGLISHHLSPKKKQIIQWVSGLFILVFLCVYAAAQLTAGSKALNVMLGWPISVGIIIGGLIVLIYSFSGGIRASIWTDTAQSVIMLISMVGLCAIAVVKTGGFASLFHQLRAINPALVSLMPTELKFGFFAYLAGWISFGVGVLGQPHILVRPMAISSTSQLKPAMRMYLMWYAIFSLSAIGVGLTARVLMPELTLADQELALPAMAQQLLPSIFVGGILAGLFSATISTADSQILSLSATITQNLRPQWKNTLIFSKLSTLFSMIITVSIALFSAKNVYMLVVLAWSGLSVILAPVVILTCLNIKVGFKTMLTMMLTSFIGILLWAQIFKFSNDINEVLIGFVISLIIFFTASKLPNTLKLSEN